MVCVRLHWQWGRSITNRHDLNTSAPASVSAARPYVSYTPTLLQRSVVLFRLLAVSSTFHLMYLGIVDARV
jgi:hypothetical protein